jgi:Predicted membrane protein (DUF2306)
MHPMVRPKNIFFGTFGLMLLFVLWNNESFLLKPLSPQWAHYNPTRWHLIPHGMTGFIALALGALQFSTRLGQRYSHLHRLFGKIYICSTFVLEPVAIWMAFVNSPWFLIPLTIVQAIVLLPLMPEKRNIARVAASTRGPIF